MFSHTPLCYTISDNDKKARNPSGYGLFALNGKNTAKKLIQPSHGICRPLVDVARVVDINR